jgi:DNA-binding transcriptional regulator YiaG
MAVRVEAPGKETNGSVPILGASRQCSQNRIMTRSVHKSAYESLRAKLRAMRLDAGLSQRALAKILRVPHSWVAKVESGERRLDVIEFKEFAEACGADPRHALVASPQTASSGKRASPRRKVPKTGGA